MFFNFNGVVLDVAQVTIGSNALFAPSVQIYTATHPISAAERRTGSNRQSRLPLALMCGWEGAR